MIINGWKDKSILGVGYSFSKTTLLDKDFREIVKILCKYIFIGPRCPWGPIYGSGCLSLTDSLSYLCADLTDVTLADEDTNSILTDNANRAIQGNVTMHVMQPGG